MADAVDALGGAVPAHTQRLAKVFQQVSATPSRPSNRALHPVAGRRKVNAILPPTQPWSQSDFTYAAGGRDEQPTLASMLKWNGAKASAGLPPPLAPDLVQESLRGPTPQKEKSTSAHSLPRAGLALAPHPEHKKSDDDTVVEGLDGKPIRVSSLLKTIGQPLQQRQRLSDMVKAASGHDSSHRIKAAPLSKTNAVGAAETKVAPLGVSRVIQQLREQPHDTLFDDDIDGEREEMEKEAKMAGELGVKIDEQQLKSDALNYFINVEHCTCDTMRHGHSVHGIQFLPPHTHTHTQWALLTIQSVRCWVAVYRR